MHTGEKNLVKSWMGKLSLYMGNLQLVLWNVSENINISFFFSFAPSSKYLMLVISRSQRKYEQ